MRTAASKRKDEKIIAALLSTPTVRAAAAATGISERQIRLRLTDADFVRVYDAARADYLQDVIRSLQHNLTAASETMVEIMQDKEQGAAVRLNAADKLITVYLKLSEIADIEKRIKEIEKRLTDEKLQ